MPSTAPKQPRKLALNKTVIAKLSPPPTGRVYVYDDRVPGLAVCVTSTGSKTWYLYRWFEGRPLRQRLATVEEMTAEQARDLARKLTGKLVEGEDIAAVKRAKREELTFGELYENWIEHAILHKRTWKEDQRKYKKFLAVWAGRRLSGINTTDVERLHGNVRTASGPYQANRVLEMVKAMYRRAIDNRLWKGDNPAAPVKKFEEHSRERFLKPDEMEAFYKALATVSADLQDFFMLLMLTGQRRGAVQAMRWQDMDLKASIWTVPAAASKSKKSVTLPLVPRAVQILKARLDAGSAYVFPSRSKTGHIVEPKKVWREIVTAAGLEGLRMHDLRRTVGSWLTSSGANLTLVGKALGHAHGSRATAGYARLDLQPVRDAMTNVTAALLADEPKPKKTRKGKGASNGKA